MIEFFTRTIFGPFSHFIGQKFLSTKRFAHFWRKVTCPLFLVMDLRPKFNFFFLLKCGHNYMSLECLSLLHIMLSKFKIFYKQITTCMGTKKGYFFKCFRLKTLKKKKFLEQCLLIFHKI